MKKAKISFKIIGICVLLCLPFSNYFMLNNTNHLQGNSLDNIKLLKVQAEEGPYGVVDCKEAAGMCPTCNGVRLNYSGTRYESC